MPARAGLVVDQVTGRVTKTRVVQNAHYPNRLRGAHWLGSITTDMRSCRQIQFSSPFHNASYANDEASDNLPGRPHEIIVPIHSAADLDAVRKASRNRIPQRQHTNFRVSGTVAQYT